MTLSPPRVALVGLGGYARQHISLLSTLHDAGICRFVAVADPFSAQHASVVAALQSRGVAIHQSLDQILEQEKTDAVFLATPIPLHAPQTVQSLDVGQHVYLEKPPCATLGEWERMNAAQIAAKRVCVVGFQMQSSPAMRFLKEQLDAGVVGELRQIWGAIRWRRDDNYYNRSPWVARWRVDSQPVFDGPATNALAHAVQGALFLAGETPLQKVRGALWRARPVESYDCAFLEAQNEAGVGVSLAFAHATAQHDEVVLRCRGEKGEAAIFWNGTVEITHFGAEKQSWHFLSDPPLAATLDFLRAISDSAHLPTTPLASTLPYLQLVNGALQSGRGAQNFAAERVNYEAGVYQVAGLDDEMAGFAANPDQKPPLLWPRETAWLRPDELESDLAVGGERSKKSR